MLQPITNVFLQLIRRFGKLWKIGGVPMKTCNLSDFMQALTPWLDDDYIRKAYLDDNGHFVLLFMDGVKNVYHIEDCEKSQLKEILEDLKNKGVPVELSG
jgi:Zn-dependent M16 (insulinase) family peptidase